VVTFAGGATLPANIGVGDKLTIGTGGGGEPGTVAIAGTRTTGTTDGTDTITFQHTTSGTNRMLLVGVSTVNGGYEEVLWIEYDGERMDFVGAYNRDEDARVEIFKLLDPNVGDHTVEVKFDSTLDREGIAGAMTFTGVDPNDPLGPLAVNNEDDDGQDDTATIDVTSGTGEMVFGVAACETCDSMVADPNQIQPWDIEVGGYTVGAGGARNGESTVTIYWELQTADHWAAAGVSVKPAEVGGGGGGEVFHILSRDSDTQVTVQETATADLTGETYTIERAYNTLQAWEDDRQGDLVADDRREIGVAYNDGDFTDALLISGSTTDADHYMRLTVAEGQRHDGTSTTGAVINACCAPTDFGAHLIQVDDPYTRIEWMTFKSVQEGSWSSIYITAAATRCGSRAPCRAFRPLPRGLWSGTLSSAAPDITASGWKREEQQRSTMSRVPSRATGSTA
jgi:hypothetical protein